MLCGGLLKSNAVKHRSTIQHEHEGVGEALLKTDCHRIAGHLPVTGRAGAHSRTKDRTFVVQQMTADKQWIGAGAHWSANVTWIGGADSRLAANQSPRSDGGAERAESAQGKISPDGHAEVGRIRRSSGCAAAVYVLRKRGHLPGIQLQRQLDLFLLISIREHGPY